MMTIQGDETDFEREYERGMLRSAFASLFWNVIAQRKKDPGGFTMQDLAKRLGRDKSQVSRWFNNLPNWEIETISDIAFALDVDLQITARDHHDNRLYTPSGNFTGPVTISTNPMGQSLSVSGQGPIATGSQRKGRIELTEMAA